MTLAALAPASLTEDQYSDLQPSAYVCWTGEHTTAGDILALGDAVGRIVAAEPAREDALINAIAEFVQAPPTKVRSCWYIARFIGDDHQKRALLMGKITVCFTVLRSCCCNYDRSPLSDRRRWRVLANMINRAERDGRDRIPTTAYRRAIDGRPIPNSTRAITPDHMAALLRHDEFRHRLMDEINANPDWRKELRSRRIPKRRSR